MQEKMQIREPRAEKLEKEQTLKDRIRELERDLAWTREELLKVQNSGRIRPERAQGAARDAVRAMGGRRGPVEANNEKHMPRDEIQQNMQGNMNNTAMRNKAKVARESIDSSGNRENLYRSSDPKIRAMVANARAVQRTDALRAAKRGHPKETPGTSKFVERSSDRDLYKKQPGAKAFVEEKGLLRGRGRIPT